MIYCYCEYLKYPVLIVRQQMLKLFSFFLQVEEKAEGEEGDEVILNIKPMQPLVRASQYGYMRGLGLHQTRTVPPSLHVSRLGQSID